MIEGIAGLSFLLGLVLSIHGITVLFANRENLIGFIGLSIDKNLFRVMTSFSVLIFILFGGLIWINLKWEMISIDSSFDMIALLKAVPLELLGVIFEELFFRLFIFSSLLFFSGSKTITVLTTSVLFSFLHFPQNSLEILSYFLGGIMYGYAFVKFQSIWVPIAIHFFWNFIQGPILGFPVSGMVQEGILRLEIVPDVFFNGGDQGPEGSVLGILIRLFIILLIFLLPSNLDKAGFLKFKGNDSEVARKK
jgi:membrane protease YdiL (CAAX protease family)